MLLKRLYFCDFAGGVGPDPCSPSGSAHVQCEKQIHVSRNTLALSHMNGFVKMYVLVLGLYISSLIVSIGHLGLLEISVS